MQLFYRKFGEGFPIIALHGLWASSDTWGGLIKELSASNQLILVDQRNHGRSPHSSQHSYELMSNDIGELMDLLEIPEAILLGHSMGGKAAMHFTLHHPTRVKGLIVEDISPLAYSPNHENSAYHNAILKALKSLDISNHTLRKEVENDLLQAITDKALCQLLLKNLARDKNGKFNWKFNLRSLTDNFECIMKGIAEHNITPSKIPTLFIKASQSSYITQKDEEAIKTFFPNSTIRTVNNSSHWIHNERQNEFLTIVKEYLSMLNSAD